MNGERVGGEPLNTPPEHGMVAPLVMLDGILATTALAHRMDRRIATVAETTSDYTLGFLFGVANIAGVVGSFAKEYLGSSR